MGRPLTSADRITCPHGEPVFPIPTDRLRIDGCYALIAGVHFEIGTCTAEAPCVIGVFDTEGPLTEGGSNVVLDDAYGAAYDAAGEYTGDLIVEEAGSSRAFVIL